ncbi:MAG: fasciclin domain-containing protein [Spirochaetes bacterium]|nr:fasciclin domain-containing protein [Spirochaetota bacterium]
MGIALALCIAVTACGREGGKTGAGMAGIADDASLKTIVQIAIDSKDHTTLVAAVKATDLVDVLANPGPFTVFAPTDAAFAKLPKGTVEGLLKKKDDLADILYNHVLTSTRKIDSFKDGETIKMFGNLEVKITNKNGKMTINGANVVASVPAANGIIHVVDTVILPIAKEGKK